MDKQPKISIIIPVYNASKYLNGCVESIISQTFSDFEVLLINDGSTDDSGSLCDAYSYRDCRIKVLHKENGGVASARQLGVENAMGLYTIHADSDDWIEPQMLETLYRTAEEKQSDMVICDYYVDFKYKIKYVEQKPTSLAPTDLIDQMFQTLHGSLCNKLVKTTCYRKNGIRFIEGVDYCEDLLFNMQLLRVINNISYLPMAFYHYVQNANENALTSKTNTKWFSAYTAYQQAVNKLALEYGKDWIVNQVEVNLLAIMIKQHQVCSEDFKSAAAQFNWDWRYMSISKPMKVLVLIARTISFNLARSIYFLIAKYT